MAINAFFQSFAQAVRGRGEATSLSRRDMLSGVGLLGGLAVAGPLLMPGRAEAIEIVDSGDGPDVDIIEVGSRGRGRRRGRGRARGRGRHTRRRPRRPTVRRHARPRHHTRRYYYSDLYGRCARDRWFRSRNPGLCRRVLGVRRPRRGACFSLRIDGAAFSICG